MLNPLFTRIREKQTSFLPLACIAATCAMLATGVIRSGQAQDSLQKYEGIASLPVEKRRVAFSNASSKDKCDFFRTHLALYLARHSEMNETQKLIILEGMALITPESYELHTDSPAWKEKFQAPMMVFQSRVRAAFSKDESANLFATFGNQEPQDDLLQKYRNLSLLPMSSRKADFRRASVNDKTDLWRTHLALYLARHPELTSEQSRAIVEVMAFLTPTLFDMSSDTRIWEARAQARLLEARIRSLFSKDIGAKIFATLGDQEPMTASSIRVLTRPVSWIDDGDAESNINMTSRFLGPLSSATAPDCGCNCSDSDWCGSSSRCYCGSCNASDWGCGFLWAYPCNGHCGPTLLD